MAQTIFYNWTPSEAYLQLNGWDTPKSPISGSIAKYEYFPYNEGDIERDLSLDHGTATLWGKQNSLVVNFTDISTRQTYQLADPGAITTDDLFVWIFPDFVVYSQGSTYLGQHEPTG